MIKLASLKRSIRQINAIVEKQIRLEMRIKPYLVMRYINPVIQLILFLFIFGLIFNIKENYSIGYWNKQNYVLFLLLGYNVQFSKSILYKYQQYFNTEKYWKTLSALMVAPVNRFTLLIGIMISEFVMICIPLSILFIIMYIIYPISLFYLFLVFIIFILIFLIFGSLGLIIGVFIISHEEYVPYSMLALRIVFLFSCTNFPLYMFPEFFIPFILLNPFYYIFDLLRLVWYLGIDYNLAITYITPFHIINIVVVTIFLLLTSMILFERVYKKYGITGY